MGTAFQSEVFSAMLLRVGNNSIAQNPDCIFSAMLLRVGNNNIAEKPRHLHETTTTSHTAEATRMIKAVTIAAMRR
jgi:hypothetical protein